MGCHCPLHRCDGAIAKFRAELESCLRRNTVTCDCAEWSGCGPRSFELAEPYGRVDIDWNRSKSFIANNSRTLTTLARVGQDRKSIRLNSSHSCAYRMPSSARKKKEQQ